MRKPALTVIIGIIAFISSAYGSAKSNCVDTVRTKDLDALAAELVAAWSKSLVEFTNVAHTTCCRVFSMSDSTNRLTNSRAYIEAILSLPKQRYDCNFAGLTARMIACRYLTERLPDDMPLSLEFKWEIISRWWLQMKDELVHFEAFGPRLPTIMYSGMIVSDAARRNAIEEIEVENQKRTQYDRQHEYAREIRGFMNGLYKFTYERQLMTDCANLSNQRKDALLQMIIDATGRVPAWYRDDLASRGLVYDLQTMSRRAQAPDSTVGASGRAIGVDNKKDVEVDIDL